MDLTHFILSGMSGVIGLAFDLAATVSAQVTPTPISTPVPTPTPVAETGLRPGLPPIVMIRGLTLGAVAFLIGLVIGRPVINWLRAHRIGKHIRIEGPQRHQIKTGTPTMGGLIFLVPLVIVMVLLMDIPRFKSLLLPLGIVISCGTLGAVDDLLSTVGRSRGGMAGRFKMAWLVAIATVAAFILYLPPPYGLDHHWLFLPFYKEPTTRTGGIDIGFWYVPIAILAIVGAANAVNLTDGLDTLAGGTSAIAFVAYGIIAYLQKQEPVVSLCFATVGALLAFLWYNAHPAMVFMGDAGSLTLGALLAVCALMTDQWLLLPLIGVIFVAVALSDILQVLYFKLTGGRRLFRMAPLHHHFEMIGWSEPQITMRFWLVSMLAGMLGVALALA